MARYVTPKYALNVPDLQEPPDVPADLRTLADRLDDVLDQVDPHRELLTGVGEPSGTLGAVNDIYFELP